MLSAQARRRWLLAARITPLTLVICGSLTWSSYSTFIYAAVTHNVPWFIAWTLPLALDGTVAVTTPIWLSTVEERAERNYAAWICSFALVASMAVNVAESGWIGVFPPFIAGLLIHLVGRVLRAGAARLHHRLTDTSAEVVAAAVELVEDVVPALPVVEPEVVPEPVETPEEAAEAPALTVLPRRYASAADMARDLLDRAAAAGEELGGAEITRKVREAGFSVGDNYGRSMKARWAAGREEVAV